MNIDPLTELTYNMSPFNYVKNNPIKFIDPNGMIWLDPEKADNLKGKINNKISTLNDKKLKLEGELNSNDLSDKQRSKVQNKISGINDTVSSLTGSLADIDALGADKENTFDLVNGGEINNIRKGKDGIINIEAPNDALHIHEIKHAALSLSSEKGLQFSSKGYLMPTNHNGVLDEISAYKAQYSYDSNSLPGTISRGSDITLEYVANLTDSKGMIIYPVVFQHYQNTLKQMKINKKNTKKNGQ